MNLSNIYTQKDLMSKVKPRHTGGYRLDLQINNVRKTFIVAKRVMLVAANAHEKLLLGLMAVHHPKAIPLQLTQFSKFFRDKEAVTVDIYNLRNYYKTTFSR